MSRYFCPCGCASTEWERDPGCVIERMPVIPDPAVLRDILAEIFPEPQR